MAGLNEGARRTFGFGAMIGSVMVALKLKDKWDEYNQLPTEERDGRVRLGSPLDEDSETTPFRDGDLETSSGKPRRKQSPDCCMCFGYRCGLFWKAFGIVCLIVVIWNAVKFALWAAKPASTGLEKLPEFSTSLGCVDAPFFFEDQQQILYTVGTNVGRADHAVDIRGAGVGTLIVAEGPSQSTDVKYEMTLRSDSREFASRFSVVHPSQNEVADGSEHSRLLLSAPGNIDDSCMRYDIKMTIPPSIKRLHIQAHATTHIKFNDTSNIELDRLYITTYTTDPLNMILPTEHVRAKQVNFEMVAGWLVGVTRLVEKTVVLTQRGNAHTNLHVKPAPSLGETPAPAILETTTGAGRSDIFFESDKASPHRPIQATHRSSRNGDIYLTYKDAEYNGKVKFDAHSYTTKGLHGTFGRVDDHNGKSDLPYVGNPEGVDKLTVSSPRGWVGLYF
ncbi:hypothetical protein QCA50_009662 [Cerrena zonata]|uniref:Uncharacterized protein n=1 Tax=Cerrena zonata TaxID=2478898 RepID=A0AAW0GAH3_9APHY